MDMDMYGQDIYIYIYIYSNRSGARVMAIWPGDLYIYIYAGPPVSSSQPTVASPPRNGMVQPGGGGAGGP